LGTVWTKYFVAELLGFKMLFHFFMTKISIYSSVRIANLHGAYFEETDVPYHNEINFLQWYFSLISDHLYDQLYELHQAQPILGDHQLCSH
jgi:hypothetical protein